MIKSIKARMNKSEDEGFTLIELLVVVLILGILMAIAIPTFLSLTSNAKKNAAESNLTTAVQDAATQLTQNGTYNVSGTATSQGDVTALSAIDPGLTWSAAATTSGTPSTATTAKSVSVNYVSTTEIILSTESQDGNSWYWADVNNGTVKYAPATTTATQPASSTFTLNSVP